MEIVRKPFVRRLVPFLLCVCLIMGIAIKPVPAKAFVIPIDPALAEKAVNLLGAALLACGIVLRSEDEIRQITADVWQSFTEGTKTAFTTVLEGMQAHQANIVNLNREYLWNPIKNYILEKWGISPVGGEVDIPAIGYENIKYFDSYDTMYSYLQAGLNRSYSILIYPREHFTSYNINIGGKEFTFSFPSQSSSHTFQLRFTIGDYFYFSTESGQYTKYTIKESIEPLIYTDVQGYKNLIFVGYVYNSPSSIYPSSYILFPGGLNVYYQDKGGHIQTEITKTENGIDYYRYYAVIDGITHYFGGEYSRPGNNVNRRIYHDIIIGNVNTNIKSNVMVDYYPDIGIFNPGSTTDDDVKIKVPVNIGSLVNAHPSTVTQVATGNPVPNTNDADRFRAPNVMLQKFPFCIPWDIYMAFSMLAAEPVTPSFDLPFNIPSLGYSQTITVDFSQFENIAKITRWFLSASFMIGLILITRKIVKG